MKLTEECVEEIKAAARKIERGDVNVKIMSRPEDRRSYDVVIGAERRMRFKTASPTHVKPSGDPPDKC